MVSLIRHALAEVCTVPVLLVFSTFLGVNLLGVCDSGFYRPDALPVSHPAVKAKVHYASWFGADSKLV